LPFYLRLVDQPEVALMNQRRGAERVARPFTEKAAMGDLAELLIHFFPELVASGTVTVLVPPEKSRHICCRRHGGGGSHRRGPVCDARNSRRPSGSASEHVRGVSPWRSARGAHRPRAREERSYIWEAAFTWGRVTNGWQQPGHGLWSRGRRPGSPDDALPHTLCAHSVIRQ